MVTLVGATMTGGALVVTAMVRDAAAWPRLSLAERVIVSAPGAASALVRVARAAFTWSSEPVIVSWAAPDPMTPGPVADRIPEPSDTATVKGRKVVLVDDVLTSGATANAATRALLRAGAARVDVLVFARVVTGG